MIEAEDVYYAYSMVFHTTGWENVPILERYKYVVMATVLGDELESNELLQVDEVTIAGVRCPDCWEMLDASHCEGHACWLMEDACNAVNSR